jgi:hypothetical protein
LLLDDLICRFWRFTEADDDPRIDDTGRRLLRRQRTMDQKHDTGIVMRHAGNDAYAAMKPGLMTP